MGWPEQAGAPNMALTRVTTFIDDECGCRVPIWIRPGPTFTFFCVVLCCAMILSSKVWLDAILLLLPAAVVAAAAPAPVAAAPAAAFFTLDEAPNSSARPKPLEAPVLAPDSPVTFPFPVADAGSPAVCHTTAGA